MMVLACDCIRITWAIAHPICEPLHVLAGVKAMAVRLTRGAVDEVGRGIDGEGENER